MGSFAFATLAFSLLGCAPKPTTATSLEQEPSIVYPKSPRGSIVDDYHGTSVPDPYRWLEDPDTEESRKWIVEQNALTHAYLETVPSRDAIRSRLETLWNYERYGIPFERGGRYFFYKNDGLQDQAVLYSTERLNAPARVLLDPNLLTEDGTVSITGVSVSRDGTRLAYGLSDGGSDWSTWHVRDVVTGEDLEDRIEWVKFSEAAWAPDGSGFWYSRYDAPEDPLEAVNLNQKLYFHRLGASQDDDVLVYARPDHPEWGFGAQPTYDGELLLVHVWQGTEEKNRLYIQSLDTPDAPMVPLLDAFDAAYHVLGKKGSTLWIRTNLDAPKGRVIAIDLDAPGKDRWVEVVPEAEETLEEAHMVGGQLFLEYLMDAHSVVRRVTLDGAPLGDVPLPGLGSASGFGGTPEATETFFAYTSFTTPTTIYRYDVATSQASVFRAPELDFDASAYETHQVFYPSKDGTRIPMFLVHKKGIALDGSNPTFLYGYGGFNISIIPRFSVATLTWLEMGGIYASANLRGGGEYGEEWHAEGTLARKQNVFDDFIAAAEWLVEHDYTRPEKLAIHGRSNGGLLAGATLLQRPDLFGAALPQVGVMDMLRYHRFTIGWAWASDYGTSDDPEAFEALRAYSPVHNARAGTYPPTLILTGDHDDRVVPAHSFKFAAALQHAQQGEAPILIRIDTRAGHGAGKSLSMQIDEIADQYAFLVKTLGMMPEVEP